MPTKMNNFMLKRFIVLRSSENSSEAILIILIQHFEVDFLWKIESQPQNPEFRINPENLHPCLRLQGRLVFYNMYSLLIQQNKLSVTFWEKANHVANNPLPLTILLSHIELNIKIWMCTVFPLKLIQGR